jgi:hypothetical protein
MSDRDQTADNPALWFGAPIAIVGLENPER